MMLYLLDKDSGMSAFTTCEGVNHAERLWRVTPESNSVQVNRAGRRSRSKPAKNFGASVEHSGSRSTG
jgi:hypothetical protein